MNLTELLTKEMAEIQSFSNEIDETGENEVAAYIERDMRGA